MSNVQDPRALDTARRSWLADLQHAHAQNPGAATALAYARGAWTCGEYDLALALFRKAHAANAADAESTVALLRAASMLARFDVESETLDMAKAHRVDAPMLSLHRSLKQVPGSIAAARTALDAYLFDSLIAQFDNALAAVESGDITQLPDAPDPPAQARNDSLRWAMRHARSRDAHVGLPIEVLIRALEVAPREGLTLECGVYFGRSLKLIAGRSAGAVHGFDSFEGLPEAWNEAERAGAYSAAGRLPAMPANVTLHQGWFEDTLTPFFAAQAGAPVRLLHIDCDLYSSTRTVLAAARPHLVPGSVLVFDDLLGYPGYAAHELRAWEEFVAAHAVRWELVAACLLGREVAVRIESITR